MQRLPASVPELVEASPSVAEDGAVLTGTHQSSVYVVDGKTGNLLRVLPSPRKQMLDQYSPGGMQTGNLGRSFPHRTQALVNFVSACCTI